MNYDLLINRLFFKKPIKRYHKDWKYRLQLIHWQRKQYHFKQGAMWYANCQGLGIIPFSDFPELLFICRMSDETT